MDKAFRYATCAITLGLLVYLMIGAFVALFLAVQSDCLPCSLYSGLVWPLWMAGNLISG